MTDVQVTGHVAPGFEAVRAAFAENFTERGEVGASVCVTVHDAVVVDLAGGWADADRTRPFGADTLVDVYSAGKAVVATLLLRQVDAGVVDLDTPVVELWPEFAVGGKERATVRHALTHRAAVPAIVPILDDADVVDWETMTAALAATPAWWVPGERHAYHVNAFGHLVGELVRRCTGRSPGQELRRVAEEIGADVWFGLPAAEHQRCADVIWAAPTPTGRPSFDGLEGDARMYALAHFNPPGYSSIGVVNTAAWRSAEVPATNGHATARGLARFYAALLTPDRVLSAPMLADASRPQSVGPCPILGEEVAFGLGFTPTSARRPLGPNPGAFGHFGTGGALGFADPVAGVAFGYAMNHVIPRWQSTRNRALITALYDALAALPRARRRPV